MSKNKDKDTNDELMDKINQLTTNDSLKAKDIEYIKKTQDDMKASIEKLNTTVEEYYVNQDQFAPVKFLVQGLAGGILLTVLIAVASLVIIPRAESTSHQLSISPAPSVLPTNQ